MKSNAFKHSHRLAFLACIIRAQLNFFWFNSEGLAMSMRRAPFQKSGILPVFWERPAWRTLTGCPGATGTNDGPGISARFWNPSGIAVDAAGTIYVADTKNRVIRKINPAGLVSAWVGQPGKHGYRDDHGTNAWFGGSDGLAIDRQGNLYVTESENRCVQKVSPSGLVPPARGRLARSGYFCLWLPKQFVDAGRTLAAAAQSAARRLDWGQAR
jgi:hypothetical protein